MLGAAGTASNDVISLVSVVIATLVSAGIIYAAFRNSFKRMVERVVDDRIKGPIEKIYTRFDEHMREEQSQREHDARVANQTATDVAYLRGRLEPH